MLRYIFLDYKLNYLWWDIRLFTWKYITFQYAEVHTRTHTRTHTCMCPLHMCMCCCFLTWTSCDSCKHVSPSYKWYSSFSVFHKNMLCHVKISSYFETGEKGQLEGYLAINIWALTKSFWPRQEWKSDLTAIPIILFPPLTHLLPSNFMMYICIENADSQ